MFCLFCRIVYESRILDVNIFLCRESTPTQISATSIVKEDISCQWVIFDAKVIHTARDKVKGPRINSKIYLIQCIHILNSLKVV